MYMPPAFREEKLEALHELIRTCPLGTLITTAPGGVVANHVPFTLYPDEGSTGFRLAAGTPSARQ